VAWCPRPVMPTVRRRLDFLFVLRWVASHSNGTANRAANLSVVLDAISWSDDLKLPVDPSLRHLRPRRAVVGRAPPRAGRDTCGGSDWCCRSDHLPLGDTHSQPVDLLGEAAEPTPQPSVFGVSEVAVNGVSVHVTEPVHVKAHAPEQRLDAPNGRGEVLELTCCGAGGSRP
jgi:hypothetical protein